MKVNVKVTQAIIDVATAAQAQGADHGYLVCHDCVVSTALSVALGEPCVSAGPSWWFDSEDFDEKYAKRLPRTAQMLMRTFDGRGDYGAVLPCEFEVEVPDGYVPRLQGTKKNRPAAE
jgi:hypothetical protein